MSWGIDFTADIFIAREDFQCNIEYVKEAIIEHEQAISECEKTILMYCAANPKDINHEDCENVISFIQAEVNNEIASIKEYFSLILKLEYYKQYLENKQNDKSKIDNK